MPEQWQVRGGKQNFSGMKKADVPTYNRIALDINAPVYDYYATRILEKTGIATGKCLDVGCGGGYLGLALAKITRLEVMFLDKSPEMLRCVAENMRAAGLEVSGRIYEGEVQRMPFDDAALDLVISRGSVPFWDRLPDAFREIMRVLKPVGRAYIGGGLGSPALRESLREQVRRHNPGWLARERTIPHRENSEYREALQAAGVERFTVTRSDEGLWIEFSKG